MDFKERGAFSQIEISILEAEHYKMGLTYTSASLNRAYQDNYYGFEREQKDDKEILRLVWKEAIWLYLIVLICIILTAF